MGVLVCAMECMSIEFEMYLFIPKAIFTVQTKIIQNSGPEEPDDFTVAHRDGCTRNTDIFNR